MENIFNYWSFWPNPDNKTPTPDACIIRFTIVSIFHHWQFWSHPDTKTFHPKTLKLAILVKDYIFFLNIYLVYI
jgi:hypothetical protein